MQALKIFFLTTALLCLTAPGLLHHPRVAAAEMTINTKAQSEQTLRIDALEKSWIRVTVDGRIVFIGRLHPQSTREWSGQNFIVKTDNATGIEIMVNGLSAEIPTSNDATTIFSWPDAPDDLAETAPDTATSDAEVDEEKADDVEAPEAATPTVSLDAETADAEIVDAEVVDIDTAEEEQPLETITYLVKPQDSLSSIGERFGVEINTLAQLNNITNVNIISVGSTLIVPVARDGDGVALVEEELPDPRGTVSERLTPHSQSDKQTSPYYETTWLTYYGRPNVPIMGILGEYNIDQLTPLLQSQAEAYDEANGPDLAITPAFHLVYGMATKAQGRDGSHLAFIDEETIKSYIERATEEEFEVILDVQVGALSPAEALALAFPMLAYDNVHLGLDPEFAMSHPNQYTPGSPPGFVTAEQVNQAQAAMQAYMEENEIKGVRVLLLHQFLASMIVNKEDLKYNYAKIALTISVDGWGPPDGKVVKYNHFVDETAKYSAFKLFYGWDRPLMSERQAMGVDSVNDGAYYIETTPNLIIYQ